MSSGVSLIDVREPNQPIVYVNAALERLTGYPAAELLGRSWKLSEGAETDPKTAARLHGAVEPGEEPRVPVRHHRRDGTVYWSESLMTPVYAEDGAVTHYMSVQKDVTEKTEAGRRAAHMAYHDLLTGLPNRAQLQEHITLLEDVARRWRSTARHSDVLARYGGDEFVLLMDVPRESARATAATAAARFVDALRAPFDTHGTTRQMVEIGVSVGIALYPEDAKHRSRAAARRRRRHVRGQAPRPASEPPLQSRLVSRHAATR